VLDLASADANTLFTQPTPATDPRFAPDGKSIAFISRDGPEDTDLHNVHLQSIGADGSGRRTLSEAVDENVLGFTWAGDGGSLYFWAFERVANKVYRVAVDGGEPRVLDAFEEPWVLGRGTDVSFDANDRAGAVVLSNASEPAEVYLLERGGQKLRRLTSLNQDFSTLAPEMEVITYESKDGVEIEALVIKPRQFEAKRRYPLLVIVHGGPPGVFTYDFSPRRGAYPVFAFAASDYALLLPNPRGSTGYGEQFRRANIRDLGGGDFQDIMAGVDLLIEKGIADPDRLGLMGWSYGGQMAYWVATHTDRFKAISAGAGITNLTSHHGTGQARGYGQHDAYWGVTPWENPELYIRHSPLFYAEQAKTPLLIQHGDVDPIVPVTQAQEFYSAAKRLGLPVEMVTYPGQGHMINPPNLLLDAMRRNLDWFDRWLSPH
jgi:dipeptidyl aminopeptidase/acylaminoacyl peptidase